MYLKKLKLVQVALHIFMFHICGFNQLWVENTRGKKAQKLQEGKGAYCLLLITCLHSTCTAFKIIYIKFISGSICNLEML